jgi:hypothetical protein
LDLSDLSKKHWIKRIVTDIKTDFHRSESVKSICVHLFIYLCESVFYLWAQDI